MITGGKKCILQVFCAFSAKVRKVNPSTGGQLVVSPDFRMSKFQIPHSRIEVQENSGRLTKKPKSQAKSTLVNSEGQNQGQIGSQPCDSP
jgi:hypothetical protein